MEYSTFRTYQKGSLLYDAVELTEEYQSVIRKVERQVKRRLRWDSRRHQMGFCFVYWETKQRILKEKYGIEWHTPSELNPGVRFD